MTKSTTTEWGHLTRHYAERSARPGSSDQGKHGSSLAKKWADLLNAASPGRREAVDRAFRQWNGIVREYIRTETALRLTVGNEAQAVPVKIVDGLPRPLEEILIDFDGLEWLLLNRPVIESAARGTRFLEEHLPHVRSILHEEKALPQREEVARVSSMAEKLLQRLDETEALRRIAGCHEDVLGAYFFRIPEIRLFWVPASHKVPRLRLIEAAPIAGLLLCCVLITVQAGPVMGFLQRTAEALHDGPTFAEGVMNSAPTGVEVN